MLSACDYSSTVDIPWQRSEVVLLARRSNVFYAIRARELRLGQTGREGIPFVCTPPGVAPKAVDGPPSSVAPPHRCPAVQHPRCFPRLRPRIGAGCSLAGLHTEALFDIRPRLPYSICVGLVPRCDYRAWAFRAMLGFVGTMMEFRASPLVVPMGGRSVRNLVKCSRTQGC